MPMRLGLTWQELKKNGNYYIILGLYITAIWGYNIGIMEKKMDTRVSGDGDLYLESEEP